MLGKYWRRQEITAKSLHTWTHPGAISELPPSTSSSTTRGRLLFTAVEVSLGTGRTLLRDGFSSWFRETSSLCLLEGPANEQNCHNRSYLVGVLQ